jgi:hypothetical protein
MVLKSQKHVFWIALLFAAVVFAAGIMLGYALENWRTSRIETLYFQAELNLLDMRIQNDAYSINKINCDMAIEENINFANRVYEDAKLLDRYESANKISESIILQHKRYDLLRALLWINSIKTKEECKARYHNVVYLYKYNNLTMEDKARQAVFSNILKDLKENEKDSIILIPLAGDNSLVSVSLLMSSYNVSESELPVILIDEKTKVTKVQKVEEIENLLK